MDWVGAIIILIAVLTLCGCIAVMYLFCQGIRRMLIKLSTLNGVCNMSNQKLTAEQKAWHDLHADEIDEVVKLLLVLWEQSSHWPEFDSAAWNAAMEKMVNLYKGRPE